MGVISSSSMRSVTPIGMSSSLKARHDSSTAVGKKDKKLSIAVKASPIIKPVKLNRTRSSTLETPVSRPVEALESRVGRRRGQTGRSGAKSVTPKEPAHMSFDVGETSRTRTKMQRRKARKALVAPHFEMDHDTGEIILSGGMEMFGSSLADVLSDAEGSKTRRRRLEKRKKEKQRMARRKRKERLRQPMATKSVSAAYTYGSRKGEKLDHLDDIAKSRSGSHASHGSVGVGIGGASSSGGKLGKHMRALTSGFIENAASVVVAAATGAVGLSGVAEEADDDMDMYESDDDAADAGAAAAAAGTMDDGRLATPHLPGTLRPMMSTGPSISVQRDMSDVLHLCVRLFLFLHFHYVASDENPQSSTGNSSATPGTLAAATAASNDWWFDDDSDGDTLTPGTSTGGASSRQNTPQPRSRFYAKLNINDKSRRNACEMLDLIASEYDLTDDKESKNAISDMIDALDPIAAETFSLIKRDSFGRFCRTEEYWVVCAEYAKLKDKQKRKRRKRERQQKKRELARRRRIERRKQAASTFNAISRTLGTTFESIAMTAAATSATTPVTRASASEVAIDDTAIEPERGASKSVTVGKLTRSSKSITKSKSVEEARRASPRFLSSIALNKQPSASLSISVASARIMAAPASLVGTSPPLSESLFSSGAFSKSMSDIRADYVE